MNINLTRTQWLLLGAALLVLLASVYAWWRRRSEARAAGQSDPTAGEVLGDLVPLLANDQFPLKRGSRGPRVAQLQRYLNERLPAEMAPLEVDGAFGPLTAAAVNAVLYKGDRPDRKATISQEAFDKRGIGAYDAIT